MRLNTGDLNVGIEKHVVSTAANRFGGGRVFGSTG